ncbi:MULTISPECIES: retroviral-like aspartic protease family protein [Pandoraea]|uniref:retroviral-like aspartic protease family protein n=1 Tax=Pandoraea TaxID=93217 RepID=UPI001F5D66DC|nr:MULTISPECIES: retroviral-like aspartic protease family protein [Pandoraea]MCI3207423.1 hypothetical protein [Pandoraea sp. LA3]MDN4585452.1 hypothetical protein [Pandoraea capi]
MKPIFESSIRYGSPEHKANPFIIVQIDGQRFKMLLDTGSNRHVMWDARLTKGKTAAGGGAEVLIAIASSTQARSRLLEIEDAGGRRIKQSFYVIDETPLMADGFSGILSPQYLADDKVSILNFKDDCFFVSDRFEPVANGKFRIADGKALPNRHRVMAIPLGVHNARIPVIVDSGAQTTSLPRALIKGGRPGRRSPPTTDLLGVEVVSDPLTKQVDLSLNGEILPRHPVASRAVPVEGGVASLGAIGMDILRNKIVFHDDDRCRFALLEPINAAGTDPATVQEHS